MFIELEMAIVNKKEKKQMHSKGNDIEIPLNVVYSYTGLSHSQYAAEQLPMAQF